MLFKDGFKAERSVQMAVALEEFALKLDPRVRVYLTSEV